MTLHFGLELDDLVYPKSIHQQQQVIGGQYYLGPKKLLEFLETQLGSITPSADYDYLRIEQYRQALQRYLQQNPTLDPFFQASFEADQLATANALLTRRDELLLTGWDFGRQTDTPDRLTTFAQIETLLHNASEPFLSGYADRFAYVLKLLQERLPFCETIILNEPFELLPPHFQRLFNLLQQKGIALQETTTNLPTQPSDLANFQKALIHPTTPPHRHKLQADGSLLVLQAKRETDAATFLAKLLKDNPNFRPLCLIPEKNRILDNAFIREGLPSLGIRSDSLARPTLQILKLVSAFFWRPVDPFKVMEFVSLTIKPLHDDLAALIAEEVAQKPGLKSERWNARIYGFFKDLEQNGHPQTQQIRTQYNFWFERRRYDQDKTVPTDEVIEVFDYLAGWAIRKFEELGSQQNSLLVLHGQAKKIRELLNHLPPTETQLTNLQLERIIRTIYEPSPIIFTETEAGHLPYVHHCSALIQAVPHVVWWNFSDPNQEPIYAKWYSDELAWLNARNVYPEHPETQNQRHLWQRQRPILNAQQQLILVIPEMIDGQAASPHPLFGDLQAIFENPAAIHLDLEANPNPAALLPLSILPQKSPIPLREFGRPAPYITIKQEIGLEKREAETFSSLDALLYYPYQWVFRHQIKLYKSSILSVVRQHTLMGNLAHRLFEILFQHHAEAVLQWKRAAIEQWVDRQLDQLLEQEGSVLLLYGYEPERTSFQNKLKYAAWMLINTIRNNGWTILGTEQTLQGHFIDTPIRGVADLVLQRGKELAIIDMKWRGATYRERLLRNEEDLQLVIYSRLLTADSNWAHTAYFIIETGKMIARNNQAFKEAIAVAPHEDYIQVNERIWDRMQKTYEWRKAQLQEGKIEVRTERTLLELEEQLYVSELLKNLQIDLADLLEMRDRDAPFDDYQALVNLIP